MKTPSVWTLTSVWQSVAEADGVPPRVGHVVRLRRVHVDRVVAPVVAGVATGEENELESLKRPIEELQYTFY